MSKKNNRADVLAVNVAFRAMAGMLQSPKKIDELKRLPAYVKDGVIYDFEDRKFWATNAEDGEIFKIDRVLNAQAVTVAIKRDYVKALEEWLGGDESTDNEAEEPAVDETPEPKKDKKSKDAEVTPEFNLKDEVKNLLHLGRYKKANKLIKDNDGHPDYKKAKKLYKKAMKANKGDS